MIFSEPSIKKFRNDFKISKIKNSEKKWKSMKSKDMCQVISLIGVTVH
jgi:hypothetical protein